MDEVKTVWLWYDGVSYEPHYFVASNGVLYRQLKSKHKSGQQKNVVVKLQITSGGYGRWNVKNPKTGKRKWITASRAVQLSFGSRNAFITKLLVAAHKKGTKKSDVGLDHCEMTTQLVNCFHKRRDNTHRTKGTTPRKLKGKDERIRELWSRYRSVKAVAELLDVKWNSMNKKLKKLGLK